MCTPVIWIDRCIELIARRYFVYINIFFLLQVIFWIVQNRRFLYQRQCNKMKKSSPCIWRILTFTYLLMQRSVSWLNVKIFSMLKKRITRQIRLRFICMHSGWIIQVDRPSFNYRPFFARKHTRIPLRKILKYTHVYAHL